MKKQLFWFFTLLLLFSACRQEPQTAIPIPPEPLLSREQMVNLLADMQLAEAAVKEKKQQNRRITTYSNTFYGQILDKYGISRQGLDDNLLYYQQDPEAFEKLFADAITRLSKMQSEVHKE